MAIISTVTFSICEEEDIWYNLQDSVRSRVLFKLHEYLHLKVGLAMICLHGSLCIFEGTGMLAK